MHSKRIYRSIFFSVCSSLRVHSDIDSLARPSPPATPDSFDDLASDADVNSFGSVSPTPYFLLPVRACPSEADFFSGSVSPPQQLRPPRRYVESGAGDYFRFPPFDRFTPNAALDVTGKFITSIILTVFDRLTVFLSHFVLIFHCVCLSYYLFHNTSVSVF